MRSRSGAFGLSTFFVGETMFFGKEKLGNVKEEIVEQVAKLAKAG